MKLKLIGLLLIATTVLFSCKKDEDNPDPNPTIPTVPSGNGGNNGGEGEVSASPTFLKVGAEYQYDMKFFFGYDSVYTVIEEQIGENLFLARNYTDANASSPTEYYKLDGDDFLTSVRMRDDASYDIICRFGKPVGTKWNVNRGHQDYVYEIVGVNESITTMNSTITDAVKIKITRLSSGAVSYLFCSPTIGVIGSGNYEDEPGMRLEYYNLGTQPYDPNKQLPPVTYGDFDFVKVGNFWELDDDFNGHSVRIDIESKLTGKNVYKVKNTQSTTTATESYYSYWFEDNGYLMVYEDGEQEVQADPIYVKESLAKIGQGWTGYTATSVFIYKINYLAQDIYTNVYPEASSWPCIGIGVSEGLFLSQTNFWNATKGQIAIGGFYQFDLSSSNAKASEMPIFPIVSPY